MLSDEEKIKQCLVTSNQGNVLIYNVPQLIKPIRIMYLAKMILEHKENKKISALTRVKYYKNHEIHGHLQSKFRREIMGTPYVPKGYFHIMEYQKCKNL